MKAVSRAINWGIKKRYLTFNPLVGMEKPSRRPREVVLTQEQFRKLVSLVPDTEFRDYLEFMWQTGCRAMEVRIIEASHVDGSVVTLAASEAKGKKRQRYIYLNTVALGIVQRRCKAHPRGPIFRDTKGQPWTANTVLLRFKRRTPKGKLLGLAAKMGIPGLCATTLRHSWATNALKAGTGAATASILMGHSDPATLLRNYQHLAQDQDFLKQAASAIPISVPVPVDIGPVVPA
jgi:integrase